MAHARRATALLALGACMLFGAVAIGLSGAAARTSRAHAHHHVGFARAIRTASRARARADHLLVRRARRVARCLHSRHRHRHRHCAHARRALQRAGARFSRADRRLSRVAARQQPVHHASGTGRPPGLLVLGSTVAWRRVPHVKMYVVVRKVPGQPDQYLVTRRTSIRPPAVPGQTVRYSARTAVPGSAWAAEVAIGYSVPAAPRNRKTAPTVNVVGRTLHWPRIGKVKTYVLMARRAGKPTRYREVSGTSTKPAPPAGATVSYSVRT